MPSSFAELLLPTGLNVDRDAVEDAVVEAFAGRAEVTGAGSGNYGLNLDLEFEGIAHDSVVTMLKRVLASLEVGDARLRFEGSDEWIRL